jgi:predicted Zn-dependent protease
MKSKQLLVCGCKASEVAPGVVARWPVGLTEITYFEDMVFDGLTREQVATCYDLAVGQWAALIGLTFRRVEDPGLARIVARNGEIDGANGVLALSDLPYGASTWSVMNQIFDPAEPWSQEDIHMLHGCMCHEIGHALGLEHIPNSGALMDPYIVPGRWRPQVPDIAAIQAIYGEPVAKNLGLSDAELVAIGEEFAPVVCSAFAESLRDLASSIESSLDDSNVLDWSVVERRIFAFWNERLIDLLEDISVADYVRVLRGIATGLS